MRILLATALFFLVACNNADKKDKDAVNVTGAWKMTTQRVKDSKSDTTYNSIEQSKIYTGDHVMYANVDPGNSLGSFGVGSYSVNGDTLSENIVYDAFDSSVNDTARTYKLGITKNDKGYKQVINAIMRDTASVELTEEYEKAGTDTTKTPLDGLWKLTKALTIKGKDTTVEKVTQYKAYYAGQFIWGHSNFDSVNKRHTGTGFGKFEMSGNDKAKETIAASTYKQIVGQSYDLAIAMNGSDEFVQTIVEKDGTKEIETYQRVK